MASILDPEDSQSISDFVKSLAEIAKEPTIAFKISDGISEEPKFPQVHALNCLREIMTNSRFRSATEQHILPLLEISTKSFSADVWAIRNCGLMLFQACIVRLEHQSSGKLSPNHSVQYEACCDPLHVALRLLEDAKSFNISSPTIKSEVSLDIEPSQLETTAPKVPETTFAALDLVKRCHRTASPDKARVAELIMNQLGNNIWPIREQAAELHAVLRHPRNELSEVGDFLALARDAYSPNLTHGALLCCRNLLQTLWAAISQDELGDNVSALAQLIGPLKNLFSHKHACPTVRAEFIEICNDALETGCRNSNNNFVLNNEFLLDTPGATDFHFLDDFDQTYAMLCRAIALNKSFGVLLNNFEDPQTMSIKLCKIIGACAASDADIAKYLLKRLNDLSWPIKTSIWGHLLCSVIELELADDVLAQAMIILSTWLLPCSQGISPEQLGRTMVRVKKIDMSSRDLFNAKLRLEGVLLGRNRCNKTSAEWREARSDIRRWILALKLAVKDEIDEPTRLSAAISVSTYLSYHKGEQQLGPEAMLDDLDILVTVYGLLRDDNEAVRDMASRSVSSLLRHSGSGTTNWLSSMPLAAGEALVSHLQHQYGKIGSFASVALNRILGVDEDFVRYCRQNQVSALLKAALKNSDSLFAEERQNLYIDDIHEIKLWCEALKDTGFLSVNQTVLQSCNDWVSDGLQALKDCLGPKESISASSFGLTYKLEVLVIYVRVIRLAGALLHQPASIFTQTQLLEQLLSFSQLATEYQLHVQVSDALDWAIQEN
jgi:Putative death-receptor fusion protein (DUF2428)